MRQAGALSPRFLPFSFPPKKRIPIIISGKDAPGAPNSVFIHFPSSALSRTVGTSKIQARILNFLNFPPAGFVNKDCVQPLSASVLT